MQTLPLIWSSIWPTLAIFSAVLAMLLVALLVNVRYSLATDPEQASAQDATQTQPPLPQGRVEHRLSVCGWCNTVLSVHVPGGGPILAGDGLWISHGMCQSCAKQFEATAPGTSRPALAGAGTL